MLQWRGPGMRSFRRTLSVPQNALAPDPPLTACRVPFSAQFLPPGAGESPAPKGGKGVGGRRRDKRAGGEAPPNPRPRTRRTRQMPASDGSNQDSDFVATQMESDWKVVYGEGEKTAVALERCSSRPPSLRTLSAKDMINRAVLHGIDNNTEKPDELKELGLL
mmetsp:Transcript_31708/g.90091  ORF Transcript_31708/g.90091 Transcript_31708/m.90091 type:complete len:163 (-) Transcript_31708:57-545(-)